MAAGGMRVGVATARAPRHAPQGLRQAAGRPARDDQRARRSRRRLGGGDDGRACGWPAPSTGPSRGRRARGRGAPGRAGGDEVLAVQAAVDARRRSAECLGGNGYIEDSGMPRLYREAPLVSIWEGSGNVAALDTLRAMAKEPDTIEAFFAELDLAGGSRPALRRRAGAAAQGARPTPTHRSIAPDGWSSDMALLLQGSLLLRHGAPAGRRGVRRLAAGRGLGRRLRHVAAAASTPTRDPGPGPGWRTDGSD